VRILGIDPGSRVTGYGVVDLDGGKLTRVAGGVVRPGHRDLAQRLADIYSELCAVIAATSPDCAALESVFAAHNARSALILGQARGAALLACGIAQLRVAEYAPTQVKGAVAGYGGAGKAQVQNMVQRLLGLDELPAADEADALAIAICHGHSSSGVGRSDDVTPRSRTRPRRRPDPRAFRTGGEIR
jgi:crossover junction endodeoxyribonuclease RuvC